MGLKFAVSMRQGLARNLLSCAQHAKGAVIVFLTVPETTTQKALLDKFPYFLGQKERNHTV